MFIVHDPFLKGYRKLFLFLEEWVKDRSRQHGRRTAPGKNASSRAMKRGFICMDEQKQVWISSVSKNATTSITMTHLLSSVWATARIAHIALSSLGVVTYCCCDFRSACCVDIQRRCGRFLAKSGHVTCSGSA